VRYCQCFRCWRVGVGCGLALNSLALRRYDDFMLDWETYFDRIVSLHVQFRTALRAFDGFRESDEAMRRFAEAELEETRKMVDEAAKREQVDPQSTWPYDKEAAAEYLEGSKERALKTLTHLGARLQQYEFILRVTIFTPRQWALSQCLSLSS